MAVSVDARSAVITARLLVGPLDVVINDSIEPQEKNIKATIPELEAEMLLMVTVFGILSFFEILSFFKILIFFEIWIFLS